MSNSGKTLTVGKLRKFLEGVAPDTEITFGSSKYRKRPLIYYRFKLRGENLLQIELNEIDQNFDPASEIDLRTTAQYFLDQIKPFPDVFEITFGSSLDAVRLEFRSIKTVVAINLEQNEEPKWKIEGD